MVVGLPPYVSLGNNYTIQITAADPATGNTQGGIVISSASLSVDPGGPSAPNLPPPSPVTGAYTTA
jgi:hypothetical protein